MLAKNDLLRISEMIYEGCSSSEIRSAFCIGNSSLTRIRAQMKAGNLDPEKMKQLEEDALQDLVYTKRKSGRVQKPQPDFDNMYERLSNRSLHRTLRIEWENYKAEYPDGYQYSQFCARYSAWENIHHPGKSATAPISRDPGRFLYIDWAGDVVALVCDPNEPNSLQKAHFFVTTLGYSSLTFAWAYPDEKTDRVIDGINRALEYYGALPAAFRPDNMKTAVTRNTSEGLILSTAMKDLQDFYNTPVLPARPLHPRDKSSVERAVQIIETQFIARADGLLFESFQDLNSALLEYIDQLNRKPKNPERRSRRELFDEYDRPVMRELPENRFTLSSMVKRKVPRICHVRYDNHEYSVPYTQIGKEVIVKASMDRIIICDHQNQKIAEHIRSYDDRNRYITVPEHLKRNQREYRKEADQPVESILQEARRIGPAMEELITRILSRSEYPEQEIKSCRAILHHPRQASDSEKEKAAAYCTEHGDFSVKAYRSAAIRTETQAASAMERDLPIHSNIRGKEYYSK